MTKNGPTFWNANSLKQAVGNDRFCHTTETASQILLYSYIYIYIKRGIPLYHRSGEKLLDPTTLAEKVDFLSPRRFRKRRLSPRCALTFTSPTLDSGDSATEQLLPLTRRTVTSIAEASERSAGHPSTQNRYLPPCKTDGERRKAGPWED